MTVLTIPGFGHWEGAGSSPPSVSAASRAHVAASAGAWRVSPAQRLESFLAARGTQDGGGGGPAGGVVRLSSLSLPVEAMVQVGAFPARERGFWFPSVVWAGVCERSADLFGL